MTTFAQNIANAGFAWKILRIKDLMSNGWVVVFPVLGTGEDFLRLITIRHFNIQGRGGLWKRICMRLGE